MRRPPRKPLVPILFAVMVSGCPVDGGRQFDIEFPRILELSNTSPDRIELTAVSSFPEGNATFFLTGGPMPPDSTRSWRIPLDAYEEILLGRFVLDGACGDTDPWELTGAALSSHIVEQEDLGKVTVAIPSCDVRGAGRPGG